MRHDPRPPDPGNDVQPVAEVFARMNRATFKLIQFDDLALATGRNYLVKGLVPRRGLVVAWGPPKCGKSFFMFDLTMHIALGWPYRERRVQQGTVVYCALEGADGFKARAEAFRRQHLAGHGSPVPFHLMTTPLNLIEDYKALLESISVQVQGETPVAVVLDTLNRSLVGSESKDEDMAHYLRAAGAIEARYACAVLIVHHSGIDASRPRGHTSLTGAADAQLAVKRDGNGRVLVTLEWMKDGPEGAVLASRLESVVVGTDADGDEITSCVVVADDEPPADKPAAGRRLAPRHKLALDALTEALLDHGADAPAMFKLPAGTKAVNLDHWKEELKRRGVIEPDAANPRQDFKRIRESLEARSLIAERDKLVWLAE
jgi:hypothetical protein